MTGVEIFAGRTREGVSRRDGMSGLRSHAAVEGGIGV